MGSIKTLATANWGSIAVVTRHRDDRHRRACRRHAGLAVQENDRVRTLDADPGRPALVYPKPLFDYIGIALFALVIAMQKLRKTGNSLPLS